MRVQRQRRMRRLRWIRPNRSKIGRRSDIIDSLSRRYTPDSGANSGGFPMGSVLSFTDHWIENAANHLLDGEIGLIPFDTVWGLGGVIRPAVIDRLYTVKARPRELPMLVIINDMTQL
ncbi:hypothetical protein EBR96_10870, partial [bacterium]|nr:hypothetical protein [bacterium]